MKTEELIGRLSFTDASGRGAKPFPPILCAALKQISLFLNESVSGGKLCIVLPARNRSAQWLAVPLTLALLKNNFSSFSDDIYRAHEHYRVGDKLMLNGKAVVAWAGHNETGICFKTRSQKDGDSPEVTVKFSNIARLIPAPGKKELSAFSKVREAMISKIIHPADRLLEIASQGNNSFNRHSICLAGAFKTFEDAAAGLLVNDSPVGAYFDAVKIGEDGKIRGNSPLLLTNDLTDLAMFDHQTGRILLLLTDSAEIVARNATNFADITDRGIPAVIITDLSESEHFPLIADLSFTICDLTGSDQYPADIPGNGPFSQLERQLAAYQHFSIAEEACHNELLEKLVEKVSAIPRDDSNGDLMILKTLLVQFFNHMAALVHLPSAAEKQVMQDKAASVGQMYNRSLNWLGPDAALMGECVAAMQAAAIRFSESPSEKHERLQQLLALRAFDYIICCSAGEVPAVEALLRENPEHHAVRVITAAEALKRRATGERVSALIVSWLRSKAMTKLLSCYAFTELVFLFYGFETRFLYSLRRRSEMQAGKIGLRRPAADSPVKSAFAALPSDEDDMPFFRLADLGTPGERTTISGSTTETIKVKEITFDTEQYFYATESHRFLVVSGIHHEIPGEIRLHYRKTDDLQVGDTVAVISTERDILVDLVRQNADPQEFKTVKYWTDLWKDLLKKYYHDNGSNFQLLLKELRRNSCIRHEATIRTWLQDENRIGPDDDHDLISIALTAGSDLLYENIPIVRKSISTMTGWRMRASDHIIAQIRLQLQQAGKISEAGSRKLNIAGLGKVQLLTVASTDEHYRHQDFRFINRILNQEGN
jgi:hypothetical protein